MLLSNCLRRINKIDIIKCLNKSSSSRRWVAVARGTNSPVNLANGSVPNVTSMTVFTRHNGNLSNGYRYYSSSGGDKNTKNDTDDDNLENWNRQLPSFGGLYVFTPSPYLMLKNALSTLLIQSFFDQHFNKSEFLAGARQAVVVRFTCP